MSIDTIVKDPGYYELDFHYGVARSIPDITTISYRFWVYIGKAPCEIKGNNVSDVTVTPLMYSCCGGSGHIRWNDTDKQWKCSDCGSIKSNDPNYFWSPKRPDAPVYPSWGSVTKQCECGSDKTYGNAAGHSSWCPKYTKV